ncbi:MAG: uroporphyrinogen decarboxylase family protein [Christensenellales bacterium]
MNSRERVKLAVNHKTCDRVPRDFGATGQTGIAASVVYKLRKALGLPVKPVEIVEPYQILGKIDDDLMRALGCDVVGIWGRYDLFGNEITDEKKPFVLPDGTPCAIHKTFEYDIVNGEYFAYPSGNRQAKPSGIMPNGGNFFDGINRSPEYDEDNLTPVEDFRDQYTVMSDEDALYYEKEATRLYNDTDYAIIGNLGGGGLGDAASLPGLSLTDPRGIRRMDDFLMAHILYPDYIKESFDYQTEIMLKNLEIYKQAVGDKILIVWISGTDFGTQNCEFISRDLFRELYKPFYKKINDWVHKNTNWKTFYHTCGSIYNILPDIVEMGVDIVNPVQISAAGMDARRLKEKFGKDLVFWGGGVDTQKTLPFGDPEQVKEQVKERIDILSKDGGYVFASIHNVVANTPIENLLALLEAI